MRCRNGHEVPSGQTNCGFCGVRLGGANSPELIRLEAERSPFNQRFVQGGSGSSGLGSRGRQLRHRMRGRALAAIAVGAIALVGTGVAVAAHSGSTHPVPNAKARAQHKPSQPRPTGGAAQPGLGPRYSGTITQAAFDAHLSGASPDDEAIEADRIWMSGNTLHFQMTLHGIDVGMRVGNGWMRSEAAAFAVSTTTNPQRSLEVSIDFDGADHPQGAAGCDVGGTNAGQVPTRVVSTVSGRTVDFDIPLEDLQACGLGRGGPGLEAEGSTLLSLGTVGNQTGGARQLGGMTAAGTIFNVP